jgi:hypothetical protein
VQQLFVEGRINFRPQPSHCDVDHVRITVEVYLPDLGRNKRVCQHFALALCQQLKQRKLLRGEVDAYVAAPHTPFDEVNL